MLAYSSAVPAGVNADEELAQVVGDVAASIAAFGGWGGKRSVWVYQLLYTVQATLTIYLNTFRRSSLASRDLQVDRDLVRKFSPSSHFPLTNFPFLVVCT